VPHAAALLPTLQMHHLNCCARLLALPLPLVLLQQT
jgi:hypothetical protein